MNTRVLGYEGAARAAAHADRATPLWSKLAWVRLLEFLLSRSIGWEFTADDFRTWAEARSLPPPPDPRAYGNVIRLAARKNRIADTGERVRSSRKECHGRDITVWQRIA